MGKRVICLICAVVLVVMTFFGVRAGAAPWDESRPIALAARGPCLSRAVVSHRPNPLASAMFLILAGIGLSMLFDKKE